MLPIMLPLHTVRKTPVIDPFLLVERLKTFSNMSPCRQRSLGLMEIMLRGRSMELN